jgi:hypothetical protein
VLRLRKDEGSVTTEAKDWLIEYTDNVSGEQQFDHCESMDQALACVRQRVENGKQDAVLYKRVPFTVHVDIEIDGERPKRRRNSSPGPASGADAHAAPVDAPAPGDSKGAASQRAAEDPEPGKRASAKAPTLGTDLATAGTTDPASPPSCGGKLCAVADGKVVHRLDPSCSKFSGTKRARAG